MSRKGSKRTGELITRLVEIGARELVGQLNVPAEQATQVMREIAHNLARHYGGEFMYVPKDQEFELTKRDMQIYERLTSGNVHELAREFGLTVRHVYDINAYVRDQIMRRRQNALPGFEEQ